MASVSFTGVLANDLVLIGFNRADATYVAELFHSNEYLRMHPFKDVSNYRRLIYRDDQIQQLFNLYKITAEHSLFR